MIKDAVIHMVGDQPMLCDVESMPTPSDVSLVCTNLRTVDGKKPLSIDHSDSWFIIPLQFIRFVEIPARSLGPSRQPASQESPGDPALAGGAHPGEGTGPAAAPVLESDDLEPDEDLLRRIREV